MNDSREPKSDVHESGKDKRQNVNSMESLPIRGDPSVDPEEAAAERILWRELDAAIEKYENTIMAVRRRKMEMF